MKSFIYQHIHPCRWMKITLTFKLQAQSFELKLYIHAQAISSHVLLNLTF
jgi:hypothetical protein